MLPSFVILLVALPLLGINAARRALLILTNIHCRSCRVEQRRPPPRHRSTEYRVSIEGYYLQVTSNLRHCEWALQAAFVNAGLATEQTSVQLFCSRKAEGVVRLLEEIGCPPRFCAHESQAVPKPSTCLSLNHGRGSRARQRPVLAKPCGVVGCCLGPSRFDRMAREIKLIWQANRCLLPSVLSVERNPTLSDGYFQIGLDG
jgi:hypothetical protein